MPIDQVEPRIFIAIGSNLEPRERHLREAVEGLRQIASVVKVSPVYESSPVGHTEQPLFLNAMVEIRTERAPFDLLSALKDLEKKLGRQERPRWHEREIDFDIIFYGDLKLASSTLRIPHPECQSRTFVLMPMADLDANFVHPVLLATVSELLAGLELAGIRKTEVALS